MNIQFIKLAMLLPMIFVLSSCASLEKLAGPPKPSVEATSFTKGTTERFNAAQPVAEWWKQLNDPQLTILIQEAVDHNLDVKIAIANVQKARALLRATGADSFPTVDTNVSYARERLSEEGITGRPADRTVNNYEAGFDAFWELDVFGRVSERIAREKAAAEESLAELRSVYVIVTAEVARTYIELRGAQYRLNIANRNEANQEKTYNLIQEMAEGGRSTNLDIARAQTLLEQTRSTIPPLEAEVSSHIHRLGVLTGQTPDALDRELKSVKPLPSVPSTVAIGDPQSLLSRRPDIRRAEQQVEQAIASYNLAVADLYPEISISGALGFASASFGDWASAGAFNTSIGPTMSWRILDRVRVRAEIDQAGGETKARIASFDKTILEALEEVETALVNFTKEEARRQSLIQAASSSATAAELAKVRFEEGMDSFLDVLDAERTQLEAEDALAQGETQTALNLIAIYKALGGGWQIINK